MSNESLLVQLQLPSGAWVDTGYLHNSNNRIWFQFDDAYWELPNRPVLGQVFEEHGRAWQPTSRVALPKWFSHLLPEGRLRQAVAHAAETDGKHEFDLLHRLGRNDLPGALRAVPADREGKLIVPVEDVSEDGTNQEDPLLKFSLAGAQLKFSVYGGEGRGLTVPATGKAGNVILKFPDGRPGFDHVPEAELACLNLARSAEIRAVEAFLISPGHVIGLEDWAAKTNGQALAVRRFDRRADDVRVHMEEFAQVLEIPTANDRAKYNKANFELIAVFAEALFGADAVSEVIDRIVLNVLVGNGDAHLKNWAVLYEDAKTPSLSPAYDIVPTVLYMPNDDLGLKLNKSRSFEDVAPKSFARIGNRTRYGEARAVQRARDAAGRIMDSWNELSEYLTAESYDTLTSRLRSLPLAKA